MANSGEIGISIIFPCLNEAESIKECVMRSFEAISGLGIRGEVIVVDNGSTDGSGDLAREAGVMVVHEPEVGYGISCWRGIREARGRYIIILDSDGTYDVGEIGRFIEMLDSGADLVIGSRFKGEIEDGAMPWLHRNFGTPILTLFLNLFYGLKLSDSQCGMRALKKDACEKMMRYGDPPSGMEFASWMLIVASLLGFSVREVPITFRRRKGRSKLRPFKDAMRHVRIILRMKKF